MEAFVALTISWSASQLISKSNTHFSETYQLQDTSQNICIGVEYQLLALYTQWHSIYDHFMNKFFLKIGFLTTH